MRGTVMYKLIWILPFKVGRKKPKLKDAELINIFDRRYFVKRTYSLFGPIYRIYKGSLSLDLYARWNELLTLYKDRSEIEVDIDKIKNIILDSKVSVEIYIATKWKIGVVVLTLTLTRKLSSSELILLIRTFRRRRTSLSLLSLKGQSTLTATEGLIRFLTNILEPYGIGLSWDEILEDLYYFVIIDKSIKVDYSKQQILGIFTGTLYYADASDKDLKRLRREIVEMRKGELIFLGSYSGGAFIGLDEKATIKFYKNLAIILLLIKHIVTLMYVDSIEVLLSKKYKVKDLRRLLNNINTAKLLITPYSLTNAYKFNNELLPIFLKNTKIRDIDKSLGEIITVIESMISKEYIEKIQLLLLLLTIVMFVLALLQVVKS